METTTLPRTIKPVYNTLKLAFGLVPIVAGLDKFTNLLTSWEQYLNPAIADMLPFSPHAFMMIIGIVEIAAGILVLRKPSIGGMVVAAWLTLIALTLLLGGKYLDVAVRDLMMGLGAFTLAKLSKYLGDQ